MHILPYSILLTSEIKSNRVLAVGWLNQLHSRYKETIERNASVGNFYNKGTQKKKHEKELKKASMKTVDGSGQC